MDMITVLVDDMTAESAYSLLLPEGPESRDRNSKELAEPGLPILLRDDRARLTQKEARGMSSRAVRELFLLRVLAVMMMTFITQRGESRGKTKKRSSGPHHLACHAGGWSDLESPPAPAMTH